MHNEELNVIWLLFVKYQNGEIKRVGWARHVARMREVKSTYRIAQNK
jgi:hypothetical protein